MPSGNISLHGPLPSLKFFTLILLYLCILVRLVGAVPKNISIDDQKGDTRTGVTPIYAPSFAWANQACTGCAIKPDTSLLFDNTSMAATFMPSKDVTSNTLDFDFNGTAVYVFFTLFYNEGKGVTVNTECNFTLDNGTPVFFNHSGDPTLPPFTKRDYQVLVFNQAGLEYKLHHLQISMSDVPYHIFLSFDYALYTIDDSFDTPTSLSTSLSTSQTTASVQTLISSQSLVLSSLSPSPTSTSKESKPAVGIIVGGVLGGLAVLAGFISLLLLYRRDSNRQQRPHSPDPAVPRPFVLAPMRNTVTPSIPRTRDVGRSSIPSTAGATGSPSIRTLSSAPLRNMNTATRASRPSPQPFSSTSSGSNTRGSSVEHRIRDANKRVQNLTAEMASTSSRSSKSRTRSSRSTNELREEIKRLKEEIQQLKQTQRSPLDPPPQYDE